MQKTKIQLKRIALMTSGETAQEDFDDSDISAIREEDCFVVKEDNEGVAGSGDWGWFVTFKDIDDMGLGCCGQDHGHGHGHGRRHEHGRVSEHEHEHEHELESKNDNKIIHRYSPRKDKKIKFLSQ